MTTTMTDLQTGRTYVFNEALPGRDAYEEALAGGFVGDRAAWLAHLRGFAFDPLEPDWAVDVLYPANAAVRHAYKLWVAKTEDIGTEPGTDQNVWLMLFDGTSGQSLLDAVTTSEGYATAAGQSASDAGAARDDAASILAQTQAAAEALGPLDVLHPVALPIPAGWWDTRDRLLSGASERAILCNWQHDSLLPDALWRGSLAAAVFDATTGGAVAAPGDSVGRVEDQSGNDLHLVQATSSLRPLAGRRPASGARNRLFSTADMTAENWTKSNTVLSAAGTETINGGMVPFFRVTDTTDGSAASHILYGWSSPLVPVGTKLCFSGYFRAGGTAEALEFVIRGGSQNDIQAGATIDLQAGAVNSPIGAVLASGVDQIAPTLWRVWVVAEAVAANISQVRIGMNNGATTSYQGDGSRWVETGGWQLEIGEVPSRYQSVETTRRDITEAGVADVWFLNFDMVDDKLAVSLPAGLTGQAFVAGAGGCYVSDLDIEPADAFEIGGTNRTWTGAAPALLRAVSGEGREPAHAVFDTILREGSFSAAEIARLTRFYRAHGGRGLLVPGAEMLLEPEFDAVGPWVNTFSSNSWSIAGGQASKVDDSANNHRQYLQQPVTLIPGRPYLAEFEIVSVTFSSVYPALIGAGVGVDGAVKTAAGLHQQTFIAVEGQTSFGVGGWPTTVCTIARASLKPLIPEEDL